MKFATIKAILPTERELRRWILPVAVVALVAICIFWLALPAQAASYFEDLVKRAMGAIAQAIVGFLGQMMLMVVGVLINVAQYNDFVQEPHVGNGWVIVRDICNMFFIAVLLVMAFATILPGDAARKMSVQGGNLVRLIVIAIIINFSRTICGLLIDLSQVIMLTFVSGFKEAAGGNFVNALGINQILQSNPAAEEASLLAVIVAYLLAIVMTAIALFTVTMICVSLIVRIIYIWLLVILSPMAFFARAVPAGFTGGIYSRWWGKFTSMLVTGPLQAFFLWLALITVQAGNLTTNFPTRETGEGIGGGVTAAFTDNNIQKFLIAVCMLLVGNSLAKEMGGEAAGMGNRVANMGKRAAAWAGKGAAKMAYKSSGAERATNWAKDKALSAATRIPLVKDVAGKQLASHRVKMASERKDSDAMMSSLTTKERKRFEGRFGLSQQASNNRIAAMGQNLKAEGNKGFRKRKPGESEESYEQSRGKWEQDMHSRRRSLMKVGKFGTDAENPEIAKTIKDYESQNPNLIIDKNEKNEKERERQRASLKKNASVMTGEQLDGLGSQMSEGVAMHAKPDAIRKALASGTDETRQRLSDILKLDPAKVASLDSADKESMKSMMAEIKQKQSALKMKNFDLLDEDEKKKRLGTDLNKDDLNSLHTQGPEVQAAVIQHGNDNNKLAMARIMDRQAVDRLPQEIGNQIRKVLLESDARDAGRGDGLSDKEIAMNLGANLHEAFTSFNGSTGQFEGADANKQLDRFLNMTKNRPPEAVAAMVPAGGLAKNGGRNEVAFRVMGKIDAAKVEDMAGRDSSKPKALEIVATAGELADMEQSDIDREAASFRASLPKGTEEERAKVDTLTDNFKDRMKQAVDKAQKLVNDLAQSQSTLRAAIDKMGFQAIKEAPLADQEGSGGIGGKQRAKSAQQAEARVNRRLNRIRKS